MSAARLRMAKARLMPNTWRLVQDTIATGVGWGVSRAFKHTATPSDNVLIDHLERELSNAFAEAFVFEEEGTTP